MNMKYICYLFVCALLISACTKTEYLIEAPENGEGNNPPGSVEISVVEVLSNQITVSWTNAIDQDGDDVLYDIAINDSVVSYELNSNTFIVSNLNSNTDYKLTVRAVDSEGYASKTSVTFHTLKAYYDSYMSLKLEYNEVIVHSVTPMLDGGYFLLARGKVLPTNYQDYEYFGLKLDSSFNIEWRKRYDWGLIPEMAPVKVEIASDGGILIAHYIALTKLNISGEIEWSYKVKEGYSVSFFKSLIELKNGGFLSIGVKNNGDYIFIKLDSSGNELWIKNYDNTNNFFPQGMFLSSENEIVTWGSSNNGHELLFFDLNGNNLGNQFIAGEVGAFFSTKVSNGYIFWGYGESPFQWAAKTSFSGATLWNSFPLLIKNNWDWYSGYIVAADEINQTQYLTLCNSGGGVSFSLVNTETGQFSDIKMFDGYPNGVFVHYNPDGYYEYISVTGYLFQLRVR